MSGKIYRLEKLIDSFSHWLNWIAGVGIIAMLALTTADIIGVKVFKSPVPGAIEMIGFLSVVVVAFAIAYTQIVHGHIQVEFFVSRLPERAQAGIRALVSLMGITLFTLLGWKSYDFARVLQTTGEVSMTQNIPFYPFVMAITFCCIPVCLVLLVQFLRSAMKAWQK